MPRTPVRRVGQESVSLQAVVPWCSSCNGLMGGMVICNGETHYFRYYKRLGPIAKLATSYPFAHDGTERRIVRPQDAAEQQASYSGKKKDHTVKNVLLVNVLLLILFLSDTSGGRVHDKRLTSQEPVVTGSRLPGVHAPPGGDPHADQKATGRGADTGAGTGQSGAAPPPPHRACEQPCQALPPR